MWIRNHHDGGWISAYWRQLHCTPKPFGDTAWHYARRIVAGRGTRAPTEETIDAAVNDLLDRAALHPAPSGARNRPRLAASRPHGGGGHDTADGRSVAAERVNLFPSRVEELIRAG